MGDLAEQLDELRRRLEAVEAKLSGPPAEPPAPAPAEPPAFHAEPPRPILPPPPLVVEEPPAEEIPAGYRLAGGGRLASDVYGCLVHFTGEPDANYDAAVAAALRLFADEAADSVSGEIEGKGIRTAWQETRSPGSSERLWVLRRRTPHATDRDARWTLEVQVAREAARSWAFVRHAFESRMLRPGTSLTDPPATPPVVAELLDAVYSFADGRRITGRPSVVETRDVGELIGELTGPRRMPIVVISRTQDEGMLVDPDAIARSLAGLAHVVVLGEFKTSFALTDAFGRERSVFLGAVRLYHPRFDPNGSPYDHPLWLTERVQQWQRRPGGFEGYVLRHLLERAMPAPPPGLEKRIREAADRQRERDVDEARRRAADAKIGVEWEAELERAWAEEQRLRAENAELLARIEELERALERERAAESDGDEAFRAVGAAVEAAAAQCETLVLLPEAFEGAWASPYQQPHKIHDALLKMDELAAAYRRNELGGSIKQAFEQAGLPFKANVSPTALGKYGREYERTYNGSKIVLGPHVAFGAGSPRTCARIYFALDEDSRTFVVGHIGQHLRDTSTG